MGHLSLLISLLSLLWWASPCLSTPFVIAPPWANETTNPCARRSWQLLVWPADGQCYQIFGRGPCPPTQELAYDPKLDQAVCRCPKDLLYWPNTDRCYAQYSKGPCEPNQYLERDGGGGGGDSSLGGAGNSSSHHAALARCADVKRCENGWIFWPRHKRCYQLYTQGPCHKGDLLIVNPLSAEPYCGCDPILLKQYYFKPLQLCYEHFTRGPCESGLLFAYNHTSGSTACMCSPSLDFFHAATGRCFQFGSKGPCRKGQVFSLDESSGQGVCSCKKGYIQWPENGQCYKAFTPGPCGSEEFIVPYTSTLEYEDSPLSVNLRHPVGVGVCVKNPCPKAHLYFPDPGAGADSVRCHKVGSRGPCARGQLVVFEKYSGKSYRGECGCSPGYNQNYWPEDGRCYEWYSRGPCRDRFLFQYNRESGRTECVCDEREGFVFWNETNECYRVYTQGPCPEHAWLIPADGDGGGGEASGTLLAATSDTAVPSSSSSSPPAEDDVFCECRAGFFFDPGSYTCRASAGGAAVAGAGGGNGSGGGAGVTAFTQPIALPLLPYQAARGIGGSPWRRPSSSQLGLLERLRLDRQRVMGEHNAGGDGGGSEVKWASGVFVDPDGESRGEDRGGGGAIRRRDDDRPPSPTSPGWGAEALPRVGRARRFMKRKRRRGRGRGQVRATAGVFARGSGRTKVQ